MVEWAEAECANAYAEAIDPQKSTNLDFTFGGIPFAESWAGGHRTVTCVLWNRFGRLSESVLLD